MTITHTHMRPRRAFTLIELLIVVAIIAILAAIAVPNFLEAQTRSKIARAAADMRSAATALETYYVDNNAYPYAEDVQTAIWMLPGGTPRQNLAGHRAGGLTSPIAYLTSVPPDPFRHDFVDSAGNQFLPIGPIYYERPGFVYVDGVRTAKPSFVPADARGPGDLKGIGPDVAVADPNETPARWVLYSLGPDLGNHVTAPDGTIISRSRFNLNNRYDPTNGTVSVGNVVRFPGGLSFP